MSKVTIKEIEESLYSLMCVDWRRWKYILSNGDSISNFKKKWHERRGNRDV